MFAQYLRRAYMMPVALGRWLGRSGLVTKHWRFNPSTQAAFQAQAVMGFYDTWVARSCSSLCYLHALDCAVLHAIDRACLIVLHMVKIGTITVLLSLAGTQMATCS